MRNAIRPGCGTKAGLFLVLIILAMIAAVAIWAWSENPPDTPNPTSTAAPPALPAPDGS